MKTLLINSLLASGGFPLWVIAVIVVAAFAVGGAVAFILLRDRKRKGATEKQAEEPKKPVERKAPAAVESKTTAAVTTSAPVVSEQPAVNDAETDEDDEEEDAPSVEDEGEEEEETEVLRGIEEGTGLAIVVRYKKSFLAKLIQSEDQTKGYYEIIKNEILSYKKTKSRTSWNYDSFNSGRNKLCKLVMRGKTLCLYTALDALSYADTKYKVEISESKKYADTPCVYRIKNARRAKYAADLIAALAEKFGLERGDNQSESYYMPYETTEELVDRGLIKELISKEQYEEFMRRRSLKVVDKNRREFVSAAEVNAIIEDEVAYALVETVIESESGVGTRRYRKKNIINIDKLSACFNAGETVTLQELKDRGLVGKDADFVKVLARGTLDKALNVEAQDYSVEAVKMILLTGGHVKKVL